MVSVNQNEELVLACIERVAEAGARAPSDRAIADELGLTEGAVDYALRKMRDRGVIRVVSAAGRRRFTIVATGASTAMTLPAESCRTSIRDARLGRLLLLVTGIADAGLKLPTNDTIADTMGGGCTGEVIAKDFRGLILSGKIRMENYGGGKRRLTITATGSKTAMPPPNQRRDARRVMRMVEPVGVEETVEPPPPASLLPCARGSCSGAAERGKAYCATHEAAEVLEWPTVDFGPVEEDIAA